MNTIPLQQKNLMCTAVRSMFTLHDLHRICLWFWTKKEFVLCATPGVTLVAPFNTIWPNNNLIIQIDSQQTQKTIVTVRKSHKIKIFEKRFLIDPNVYEIYSGFLLMHYFQVICLFLRNSLSHSETTWTARVTMCWVWHDWLKTYWLRFLISWSPTWRAEALNPFLSHRFTRLATTPKPTLSESCTQLGIMARQGGAQRWREPASTSHP